jgi:hypothetical protein
MTSATVIEWLLYSLRKPLEEQKSKLLPSPPDMDWDEFMRYADRHGLSPLVYNQLQSDVEVWSMVPAAVQEQLVQRYRFSAHRNLKIYYQFLKLVRNLQKDDIQIILLKGVFLAYAVYGDRALRPMLDVDILVKRKELTRIENALLAHGFRLSDWKHRDWCLKNHYHLVYYQPELSFNLEIHWDIQRPNASYPIEIDELWQGAQAVTIAGVELMTLSLEHLLLYQCLHIAKHSFGLGLRNFCDLAAILERYQHEIDWQQVQAEAMRWHIAKALYLSLYFTNEFFGIRESVMDTLQPANIDQEVIETAREQILTSGSQSARLSAEFLKLMDGEPAESKVPVMLRRLFLPRDLMASIYHLSPNSWRIYLFYPVRFYDLLVRYPFIIRRILLRDRDMLTWVDETNRVNTLRKWLVT